MDHEEPDMDVAIIGGGPAGAALAAYLARAGVNVSVFEREVFPRPHVGESLVPSSTRVLRELNFLSIMEREKFPHKLGAVWTATGSSMAYEHGWEGLEASRTADIRFAEREQAGVEQPYTYHVDRGRFDHLLLHHAAGFGANVIEGVGVKDVDFSGKWPRLTFGIGRKDLTATCKIAVDASGRRTLLGNRLKLKVMDKVFDQYAIHTWFEGHNRLVAMGAEQQDKADFIYVHFLPVTNSWVWQIPISDDITSVGVVTQRKHFKGATNREDFFWTCVSSRPELYESLRRAKRIREFSEEGDYSYAMRQIVGDNWLMIGDAARFVDPIFSTGVSIALNSARFAHKDILGALESGNFSRESFANYETTLRRGARNWYNFIAVYYRLNVLFTAFIRDPRYRLDVLKLLQGDVYDEDEPEVLAKMRDVVRTVEGNPNHVWHRLLGELTANEFRPAF